VRRLSRATAWLSEAPQTVQKRMRSGFCSPQPGQMRIPASTSGTMASPSVSRSCTETSRYDWNVSSEPFGLTRPKSSTST
jgi:hypothetical protein